MHVKIGEAFWIKLIADVPLSTLQKGFEMQ